MQTDRMDRRNFLALTSRSSQYLVACSLFLGCGGGGSSGSGPAPIQEVDEQVLLADVIVNGVVNDIDARGQTHLTHHLKPFRHQGAQQ